MNEEPPNHVDDPAGPDGGGAAAAATAVVEVGTAFQINLYAVSLSSNSEAAFQSIRRAMMSDETPGGVLTELTVCCAMDVPTTGEDGRQEGFVPFLRRYISNQVELQKFTLACSFPSLGATVIDVSRQFIMAAAASESIHRLRLKTIIDLPIQALAEFCRLNRNVKVLEMRSVGFVSDGATSLMDFLPLDDEGSTTATTFDKVILDNVTFEGPPSTAARLFASAIAPHFRNLSALVLGRIRCECDEAQQIVARAMSNLLKNAPVTHLELQGLCSLATFRAALMDGKDTVEELSIEFHSDRIDAHPVEKINNLFSTALAELSKVRVLRLSILGTTQLRVPPSAKMKFFQAIDAGATLTELAVDDETGAVFRPHELQLLRRDDGRAERNRKLHRFLADPPAYPARNLLQLMLQLERCPTGSYQLARALPQSYFARGGI